MYKIIDPVTDEPITLADAKLHLRVDSDDEDDEIEVLITAAREYAEHYTGRSIGVQTLEMALAGFPLGCDLGFDLAMPPVSSIESVKYTDSQGAEQTVDPVVYALDTYGLSRRVAPVYGGAWPSAQPGPMAARVRYVAGYAIAPKAVVAAMKLHMQIAYDKLTPAEQASYAKARDALLDTLKIWGV